MIHGHPISLNRTGKCEKVAHVSFNAVISTVQKGVHVSFMGRFM